jgi:arylsulfatase A-like enzyme
VPPSAHLRGFVDGEATVRLRREGGAAREVVVQGELDLDLTAETHAVVRLEIDARDDLRLHQVAVHVPATESRTLTKPKNVLLILVDTLRADRLEPYAVDTRVQTPGLSAFARGATTFVHAHSQENWTKPSVATLLTSLMPWEHSATLDGSVLPNSVTMLPEVLQDRGFRTGSFICNGFVSDRFGFRQGWDTYRNYIREGRRTKAEFVAADVLAWLDTHQEDHADNPFFLYVHTIDPHVPYRPPQSVLEMYGGGDYNGAIHPGRTAQVLEEIKLGRLRATPADRAFLEALYDGEISYHDVHFRAILEGLESRGLADDTMVLLTSEHGEEFWDHGSVGHGHSVYEELLHVPLFVRIPGEAPRRIETPVGLVDVMPTILEALEVEAPPNLSGRSFLNELRGEPGDAPRATVSGFMENWRTVTVGRWKLVQRPRNRSRLYDLQEDPGEAQDLADTHPLTVRWLRGLLGLRLQATRGEVEPGRRRHRPERTVIDDETAAQLRALGYLQ